MGMTYIKMEAWDDAVMSLSQADKVKPDNYVVLKSLARALMKLKRTEELEQTYLRMLELNPEDHTLYLYLGQIAFNNGRTKEALVSYRKAIELNPEDFIGWKVLADALESLGMHEDAKQARERRKAIIERLRKEQGIFGPI
jgi:tetratricopeptide (TPR) repeat protein